MKSLVGLKPEKILIRSTNWIGDAIMTTPAVRTIRSNFPRAHIAILCYPWVADVFRASPHVDEIIIYDKKGRHAGFAGLWRMARELATHGFDLAILLQNAFEAALLTLMAGIPARAGYRRDARSLLLTHPVRIRPATRKKHHLHYYQTLLADLGLTLGPDSLFLELPEETRDWARQFVAELNRPLIGLNPGAAYGPAKCWPTERYGELAGRLADEFGATLLVFGTAAENRSAAIIDEQAPGRVVDVTGKTSLAQAMALIGCCQGFVTNDSGLMHVAAALGVPLVGIFGSTDLTTGPFSANSITIKKELPCSPCFKVDCKTDFRCMRDITVDEVMAASREMLGGRQS